jgi:ATP-dependent DNA helicase RecG
LTLTIFGDLDLSIISELPKGRKEIITKIVSPLNRDKAYAFIRGQVKKGRQVFVICPRIDSDTQIDTDKKTDEYGYISINQQNQYKSVFEVKAVKEEYEKLSKKVFPDLRVGLLHGKMSAKEKKITMKQFSNGAIDILVSTSVVEVGVDIPNATIMMIEGSEQFGLAQLYQFRGRVGRGEHQSFCFLFTDSSAKTTYQRLHALLEAKNGFELAEKDLEIRGPGEFLGESQTGMPDLAMKAIQNPDLVKASREAAETILKNDPELKNYPVLLSRIESFSKQIHLE